MSVTTGQDATAPTFNNAFGSKAVNNTFAGQQTLSNVATESGSSVSNIQREFNALSSYLGKALNVAKDDKPDWTSTIVGDSGDNVFQRADALVQKFLGASGHGHTGNDGDGDLIDLTSAVVGVLPIANTNAAVSYWSKKTFTNASFSTAATTNDIELLELESGEMIESIIIKHSTAFSGGSISAYSLSVGIASDLIKYATDFNVFQTVAESAHYNESYAPNIESFASATSIRIRATSVGGNLSTATAGTVDVWVKRSRLA